MMRVWTYTDGAVTGTAIRPDAISGARAAAGTLVWVDALDPTAHEVESLAGELGLNPLAVEDVVHGDQRTKLERYGDHFHLVTRDCTLADHHVEAREVDVLFGDGWIVTIHRSRPGALGEPDGHRVDGPHRPERTGGSGRGGRPDPLDAADRPRGDGGELEAAPAGAPGETETGGALTGDAPDGATLGGDAPGGDAPGGDAPGGDASGPAAPAGDVPDGAAPGPATPVAVPDGGGNGTIDEARRRYELQRREHGSNDEGFVLWAVLDVIVDRYFTVVERVDESLEDLEEIVFAGEVGEATPREVFTLRRAMVTFRRAAAPLREVIAQMLRREVDVIGDAALLHLQDVYDHVLRVADLVESQRDVLTGLLEAHLAVASNRMNEVMKLMSSWGAILLGATLIAGIYGMNFSDMPELRWRFGYPLALGMMAVLTFVLYRTFRRRGWL